MLSTFGSVGSGKVFEYVMSILLYLKNEIINVLLSKIGF